MNHPEDKRIVHNTEQRAYDLRSTGDRRLEDAYRMHIGYAETWFNALHHGDVVLNSSVVALKPSDLSDAELSDVAERLATQVASIEQEAELAREEARLRHAESKELAQRILKELATELAAAGAELDGLLHAHVEASRHPKLEKFAAELNAITAEVALSRFSPTAVHIPDSLAESLAACRKEQRQRQAGKQAEVEKLRSQLAALGIGV